MTIKTKRQIQEGHIDATIIEAEEQFFREASLARNNDNPPVFFTRIPRLDPCYMSRNDEERLSKVKKMFELKSNT